MTMLERAARALAESDKCDWDRFSSEGRENYTRRARAVLLAIREADEGMVEEGVKYPQFLDRPVLPEEAAEQLGRDEIGKAFTAMIDHILADPTP